MLIYFERSPLVQTLSQLPLDSSSIPVNFLENMVCSIPKTLYQPSVLNEALQKRWCPCLHPVYLSDPRLCSFEFPFRPAPNARKVAGTRPLECVHCTWRSVGIAPPCSLQLGTASRQSWFSPNQAVKHVPKSKCLLVKQKPEPQLHTVEKCFLSI